MRSENAIPTTSTTRAFLIRSPDGGTSAYPIAKKSIKIGRLPGNDLVLGDSARSVSRSHALITIDPAAPQTLVNGVRISSAQRINPRDDFVHRLLTSIFEKDD